MSGIVNQAGSRSGVVGQMADVVLLKRDKMGVSAASAWTCTNVFRREFRTIEVKIPALKFANDNVSLRMVISSDNCANFHSGNHYDSQIWSGANGSWGCHINADNAAYAVVMAAGNQGATGNEGGAGSIFFCDPMNPTARKNGYGQFMEHMHNTEMNVSVCSWSYETSDAINSFKLYPSSGNFDTGANYNQVSVYGYR